MPPYYRMQGIMIEIYRKWDTKNCIEIYIFQTLNNLIILKTKTPKKGCQVMIQKA